VAAYMYPATAPPSSGGDDQDPAPAPTRPGGPGDVSHVLNTKDHMQYVWGFGNNDFKPEQDMSRAETAQLFYNLLLNKNVPITKQFPDVPADKWYAKAVLTLASLGLITGYPDGSYRPDASVTRAEFTALTTQFAAEYPEITLSFPFYDVAVTHWAYRYINAAVQYGWVVGYGDGRFAPEDNITRAEVVTLVNRMLGRVPDREYIDSHTELLRFSDVPATYWQFYGIMEAYHEHDYEWQNGVEKWIDTKS